MPQSRVHPLLVIAAAMILNACSPPPKGDFDLVADGVTHSPDPVHVGDKVVFNFSLKNDGKDTVPAGSFHVDLYLDGNRIDFDHSAGNVTPGGTIRYGKSPGHHHWQPMKPGRYHYKFSVDETGQIPEQNKANNTLEGDIEVLP